ncbi:uncharacterized protein N0V89_004145 [Didymosphaeria variabile]|uniref:Uncharacterized protein n=1 Tax=Didymosphaeria variabile TaxID=1932322 RepID=A0A9W8XQ07_9PLEO|nr:uncharacterized protein N0V89_004145 [Didymosphaeria variabile]KAJ4356117.1 hypothetical protein N0V89_004145 [Didymosphaeria variabile]
MWFNKIGNREMYMNCAVVDLVNSASTSSSRQRNSASSTKSSSSAAVAQAALSRYPDLYVANLKSVNDCATKETVDVMFDKPGADVLYGDGLSASSSRIKRRNGACTGVGRTTAASSGSDSSNSGLSADSSASSNAGSSSNSGDSGSSSSSGGSTGGDDGMWHPEKYGGLSSSDNSESSSSGNAGNSGSSSSSDNSGSSPSSGNSGSTASSSGSMGGDDGLWHPEKYGGSSSSGNSESSSSSNSGSSSSSGSTGGDNGQWHPDAGSSQSSSSSSDGGDGQSHPMAISSGSSSSSSNQAPKTEVEKELAAYLKSLNDAPFSSVSPGEREDIPNPNETKLSPQIDDTERSRAGQFFQYSPDQGSDPKFRTQQIYSREPPDDEEPTGAPDVPDYDFINHQAEHSSEDDSDSDSDDEGPSSDHSKNPAFDVEESSSDAANRASFSDDDEELPGYLKDIIGNLSDDDDDYEDDSFGDIYDRQKEAKKKKKKQKKHSSSRSMKAKHSKTSSSNAESAPTEVPESEAFTSKDATTPTADFKPLAAEDSAAAPTAEPGPQSKADAVIAAPINGTLSAFSFPDLTASPTEIPTGLPAELSFLFAPADSTISSLESSSAPPDTIIPLAEPSVGVPSTPAESSHSPAISDVAAPGGDCTPGSFLCNGDKQFWVCGQFGGAKWAYGALRDVSQGMTCKEGKIGRRVLNKRGFGWYIGQDDGGWGSDDDESPLDPIIDAIDTLISTVPKLATGSKKDKDSSDQKKSDDWYQPYNLVKRKLGWWISSSNPSNDVPANPLVTITDKLKKLDTTLDWTISDLSTSKEKAKSQKRSSGWWLSFGGGDSNDKGHSSSDKNDTDRDPLDDILWKTDDLEEKFDKLKSLCGDDSKWKRGWGFFGQYGKDDMNKAVVKGQLGDPFEPILSKLKGYIRLVRNLLPKDKGHVRPYGGGYQQQRPKFPWDKQGSNGWYAKRQIDAGEAGDGVSDPGDFGDFLGDGVFSDPVSDGDVEEEEDDDEGPSRQPSDGPSDGSGRPSRPERPNRPGNDVATIPDDFPEDDDEPLGRDGEQHVPNPASSKGSKAGNHTAGKSSPPQNMGNGAPLGTKDDMGAVFTPHEVALVPGRDGVNADKGVAFDPVHDDGEDEDAADSDDPIGTSQLDIDQPQPDGPSATIPDDDDSEAEVPNAFDPDIANVPNPFAAGGDFARPGDAPDDPPSDDFSTLADDNDEDDANTSDFSTPPDDDEDDTAEDTRDVFANLPPKERGLRKRQDYGDDVQVPGFSYSDGGDGGNGIDGVEDAVKALFGKEDDQNTTGLEDSSAGEEDTESGTSSATKQQKPSADDAPKDASKDASKDTSDDASKDTSDDASKDTSDDASKDTSDDTEDAGDEKEDADTGDDDAAEEEDDDADEEEEDEDTSKNSTERRFRRQDAAPVTLPGGFNFSDGSNGGDGVDDDPTALFGNEPSDYDKEWGVSEEAKNQSQPSIAPMTKRDDPVPDGFAFSDGSNGGDGVDDDPTALFGNEPSDYERLWGVSNDAKNQPQLSTAPMTKRDDPILDPNTSARAGFTFSDDSKGGDGVDEDPTILFGNEPSDYESKWGVSDQVKNQAQEEHPQPPRELSSTQNPPLPLPASIKGLKIFSPGHVKPIAPHNRLEVGSPERYDWGDRRKRQAAAPVPATALQPEGQAQATQIAAPQNIIPDDPNTQAPAGFTFSDGSKGGDGVDDDVTGLFGDEPSDYEQKWGVDEKAIEVKTNQTATQLEDDAGTTSEGASVQPPTPQAPAAQQAPPQKQSSTVEAGAQRQQIPALPALGKAKAQGVRLLPVAVSDLVPSPSAVLPGINSVIKATPLGFPNDNAPPTPTGFALSEPDSVAPRPVGKLKATSADSHDFPDAPVDDFDEPSSSAVSPGIDGINEATPPDFPNDNVPPTPTGFALSKPDSVAPRPVGKLKTTSADSHDFPDAPVDDFDEPSPVVGAIGEPQASLPPLKKAKGKPGPPQPEEDASTASSVSVETLDEPQPSFSLSVKGKAKPAPGFFDDLAGNPGPLVQANAVPLEAPEAEAITGPVGKVRPSGPLEKAAASALPKPSGLDVTADPSILDKNGGPGGLPPTVGALNAAGVRPGVGLGNATEKVSEEHFPSISVTGPTPSLATLGPDEVDSEAESRADEENGSGDADSEEDDPSDATSADDDFEEDEDSSDATSADDDDVEDEDFDDNDFDADAEDEVPKETLFVIPSPVPASVNASAPFNATALASAVKAEVEEAVETLEPTTSAPWRDGILHQPAGVLPTPLGETNVAASILPFFLGPGPVVPPGVTLKWPGPFNLHHLPSATIPPVSQIPSVKGSEPAPSTLQSVTVPVIGNKGAPLAPLPTPAVVIPPVPLGAPLALPGVTASWPPPLPIVTPSPGLLKGAMARRAAVARDRKDGVQRA